MKVRLNGELLEFDGSKKPMSEALALEKAWHRRYAEWESELAAGSAEALCVLAWLVWRRDGRDVQLDDILSGAVDFDFGEFVASLAQAGEQAGTEESPEQAGPATPAG